MLTGEMWFGRTTIMVQYWRSIEQLMAYAKDRQAEHRAHRHITEDEGERDQPQR